MVAEEYNDAKLRAMNEANYIEDWQKDKHGRDINFIENEEQRMDAIAKGEVTDASVLGRQQRKRHEMKENVKRQAAERQSGAWFRKYQTQADKLQEEEPTESQ